MNGAQLPMLVWAGPPALIFVPNFLFADTWHLIPETC